MSKIPFKSPVRVGNYKVWKSTVSVGKKRDRMAVEAINVSNLDGTWSVRIPQTSTMFGTVTVAFDEGGDVRDNFLGMVFGNMQNVCLINNEYLHDAFNFLLQMMEFPYLLLSEDEMAERMRKGFGESGDGDTERIEAHISKMREYRGKLYALIEEKKARFIEDYERQMSARRIQEASAEADMEREVIAEEAMDILGDGE